MAYRIVVEALTNLRRPAPAASPSPTTVQAIRDPAAGRAPGSACPASPSVPDPTRVIVVTTFDLDEYVHTALRDGACGYLLKRSGPTLLIEAVRAAMAGRHRRLGMGDRTSETVGAALGDQAHDLELPFGW